MEIVHYYWFAEVISIAAVVTSVMAYRRVKFSRILREVEKIVSKYGVILVDEVAKIFGLSEDAIRRYLEAVERKGLIRIEIKEDLVVFKEVVAPALPTPVAETVKAVIPGYVTLDLIGAGGFSTVFRARDEEGNIIALKIMNITDKDTKKVFMREISFWKPLDHPNIVKLLDYGIEPVPFIAMELMDGTLRDKLKEGPLPVKEALKIVLNVAVALEYAHKEFALVHRDIKPENVLFKGEVYKLSD